MLQQIPAILASVLGNVIVAGIVILFMVAKWIAAEHEKKKAAERAARMQSNVPQPGTPGPASDVFAQASAPAEPAAGGADEMAARRRQQLEELMKRRRVTPNVAPPTRPTQPARPAPAMNLPAAAPPRAPRPVQAMRPASREQAMAQARQRQAAARIKAKQIAQAREQQARQKQARQQQSQARTQNLASRPAAAQRSAARPAPAAASRRIQLTDDTGDTGASVVHRHVTDAPDAPGHGDEARAQAKATGSILERLNASSIRDAIILKELLDPPLALREDDDLPM